VTSKPVRLSRDAELEAESAARWYEARSPGLGVEFLSALAASLEAIEDRGVETFAEAPDAPSRKDVTFRVARLRDFPYRVVFAELAEEVRVYAVAHERRRPGYWKKRLED